MKILNFLLLFIRLSYFDKNQDIFALAFSHQFHYIQTLGLPENEIKDQ